MVEQDFFGKTASFWDLPSWVQLFYTAGALVIVFSTARLFPFVANKIENLLENENRASIFKYVTSNPGTNIAQVSQNQNINRATVKYHLYKLESQGKIIFRRIGKYSRIFKGHSAYGDEEKIVLSHMQNTSSRSILLSILERPGITNQELSWQLDVEKSAIHWHMNKLLKDGLIMFNQDGKFKRYFIQEDIAAIVRKFMSQSTGRPFG